MMLPSTDLDAPAPRTQGERHVLTFDPAQDGFGFVNAFAWTEDDLDFLVRALRPLASGLTLALSAGGGAGTGGRQGLAKGLGFGALAVAGRLPDALVRGLARRWSSFGLCGGMALAAQERWPARAALPTAALQREHMRALLRRSQARTIRAAGARFLRYWLQARFVPGYDFGPMLRAEAERIQDHIDAGRPALVGLVGDAPDPFTMHQVLAFGYARELDGTLTLFVYDPNTPGRTQHLHVHPEGLVTTDLAVGPKRGGGYFASTQPGQLALVFLIQPD